MNFDWHPDPATYSTSAFVGDCELIVDTNTRGPGFWWTVRIIYPSGNDYICCVDAISEAQPYPTMTAAMEACEAYYIRKQITRSSRKPPIAGVIIYEG